LTGPDQSLPPVVRVKHGQNRKGRTLHYFLNYSVETQSFDYAYGPGTDLLAQNITARGQKITLQPWDAAIIEEK
jgi:beta-galactosidase